MLGKGRLTEIELLVEFADGEGAFEEVAQDQQALLVAERLEQVCSVARVRLNALRGERGLRRRGLLAPPLLRAAPIRALRSGRSKARGPATWGVGLPLGAGTLVWCPVGEPALATRSRAAVFSEHAGPAPSHAEPRRATPSHAEPGRATPSQAEADQDGPMPPAYTASSP